jgi:hypothetical protein
LYLLFFTVMTPNAGGEPRPEAGAQRTLLGVGSTALFGPDPVGEPHCVEKGKPYFACSPALSIMRIGAAFGLAKTRGAYFAGFYTSFIKIILEFLET